MTTPPNNPEPPFQAYQPEQPPPQQPGAYQPGPAGWDAQSSPPPSGGDPNAQSSAPPGGWGPNAQPSGPPSAAPGGWDPNAQPSGPPGGYAGAPGYAGQAGNPAQPGYPGGGYPGQPGVPPGGYSVPPPGPGQAAPPGYDPLISPDYNGWFSRGTALVKAGWKPLAVLQAIGLVAGVIVQVPVLIWTAMVSNDLARAVEDDPENFTFGGSFAAVMGLTILGAFVAILVAALVTLASMRIGVAIATGVAPDVGAALRGAASRMFPLIGWQILAGFIMVAGICACVLPVIYLYAVFITVPAVVAFERTNVISRCFTLFHRELGTSVSRVATIAGLTIAAGIAAAIIDGIINAITGASTGQFGGELATDVSTGALVGSALLSTVISALIGGAAAVFTSQLTLTAYADLRARVEPLTTGVLASEIGLQPPAPTF